MTEDQLQELWNKMYDFADIGIDYGELPDAYANKAVEIVKEILGEE